jgi:peptidoglycan/LPS O-acetylase OafA/YrhL
MAVLLVLVFHLWPRSLPGGFVGVDVFFAISGFLITSHLLREVDRTGRVSLPRFWARRARRLLPASLAVLALSTIATVVVVPLTEWEQFLGDIQASTTYVQNWHLADAAVDYFAADNAPSPVQHYWSLSVEEQFYLAWPVLILGATVVVASRRIGLQRPAIAAVLGAVTAASLTYALVHTEGNPEAAYFSTPARAWEFGAGGLLALAPAGAASGARLRVLLSWLGLGAILLAASTYSEATPFPGHAALLPVAGALAVMRAGTPIRRWSPKPLLELRPVQFVGDVSYGVYLWHWPLIILAPYALTGGADTSIRAVIFMFSILAAWLMKVLVEDPVRTGRFLTRRPPQWTFCFSAAGMAAVLAFIASATSHVQRVTRDAEARTNAVLAATPACFGAASRDPSRPCSNPKLRRMVVPSPLEASKLPNAPCERTRDIVTVCAFGATRDRGEGAIALIGDSHATHWRGAVGFVARRRGWRGLSVTHSSCPLSRALRDLSEPSRSSCIRWKRDVFRWLARRPDVHTVFVTGLAGGEAVVPSGGRDAFQTAVAGYIAAWRDVPPTVKRMVVLRDTPKAGGDTPACVERARARGLPAGEACALPRRQVLDPDPMAVAVGRAHMPRVRMIDMTPFFCGARSCLPVVGGALVHKDPTHLTTTFARTLGPPLDRAVERVLDGTP